MYPMEWLYCVYLLLDPATDVKDWMELWYFNGDVYHSYCNGTKKSSRLIFLCDQNAVNVSTITYYYYIQCTILSVRSDAVTTLHGAHPQN